MGNPESALTVAFEEADKAFLRKSNVERLDDGSTGLVSLIRGNALYVAHIGDSRAILCDAGRVCALTKDHTPIDETERKLVLQRGGAVVFNRGQWRFHCYIFMFSFA